MLLAAALAAWLPLAADASAVEPAADAEADPAAAADATDAPIGVVRPSREVVLRALTGGSLAEVAVREGAAVAAGDLLARLDDSVQAARVAAAGVRASATAEAVELAAVAEQARRELGRTEEAAASGAAPAWELEAARTAVTVAEARRDAAGQRRALAAAELAVEEALLAQHRLVAPFDAVVLAVEAAEGGSVAARDPVLRLAALDPLHAVVYLPERLHDRLAGAGRDGPGPRVRFRSSLAGAEALRGRLIAALPEIDPGSRSFRCVFEIENPGGRLPAGFTVGLDLATLGADPVADAAAD
ncbi:efflux RND transporter periplasmic adaptor subunit [Phycisphaera mikurensis]|nr:efflux RND transporter periplasmic adaptor subunit [Phycisphaera mikurensis]MBB6442197.1 RND family efflux transporter MFP subunit [Phycisphaera mikurensis]